MNKIILITIVFFSLKGTAQNKDLKNLYRSISQDSAFRPTRIWTAHKEPGIPLLFNTNNQMKSNNNSDDFTNFILLIPKIPDSDLRKSYKLALISALNYDRSRYDFYTKRIPNEDEIFHFQAFTSKVIFLIVLLVVFFGLSLSALQFYQSTRISKQIKNATKSNNETENEVVEKSVVTNLELTLKGVKISTSVIGLIILIISLAFFYLYLVYVYPIQIVK